jgi:hypothetical protein
MTGSRRIRRSHVRHVSRLWRHNRKDERHRRKPLRIEPSPMATHDASSMALASRVGAYEAWRGAVLCL